MTHTALAPHQTVWNCRWSRPGFRFTGLPASRHVEGAWICTRECPAHSVDEADCRTCASFEAMAPAAGPAVAATLARRSWQAWTSDELLGFGLRATVIGIAIMFITIGLSTLTSPPAVLFAIACFMIAAACVGWVAFGTLPGDVRPRA